MTRHRITLALLADELGVSRTTVSNAFSRPDQLSPTLRQRILDAAAVHGYTGPDPLARGLARGRVGIVGLLLAARAGRAFADPAMRVMLDGLVSTLARGGVGLLLLPEATVDGGPAASVPVDGFVVLCCTRTDPTVLAAKRRGLPMVAIDQPTGLGFPVLRNQDFDGAAEAARHLVELGHQRVAILTLQLVRDDRSGIIDAERRAAAEYLLSADRLDGYIHGLGDVSPVVCWEAPYSHRENGRHAANEILRAHPDVTAFLVSSDELAFGVLEAVNALGKRVPKDVSVVGFDDVGEAATAAVSLTTIRQELFERGVAAAVLMLDMIAGDDGSSGVGPDDLIAEAVSSSDHGIGDPYAVAQSVTLVVRASTGPPPTVGDPAQKT